MLAKDTLILDSTEAQELVGSFCLGDYRYDVRKTTLNRWVKPLLRQKKQTKKNGIAVLHVPYVDFMPMLRHMDTFRHNNIDMLTVSGLKEISKLTNALRRHITKHVTLIELAQSYGLLAGQQRMHAMSNAELADYIKTMSHSKLNYQDYRMASPVAAYMQVGDYSLLINRERASNDPSY